MCSSWNIECTSWNSLCSHACYSPNNGCISLLSRLRWYNQAQQHRCLPRCILHLRHRPTGLQRPRRTRLSRRVKLRNLNPRFHHPHFLNSLQAMASDLYAGRDLHRRRWYGRTHMLRPLHPCMDPPTTATEPTNTAFELAALRSFWQDTPSLSSVPAHYVTALNLPRQVKGGKSREYLNGLGEGRSIEECLHYFATQFTQLRMPKIRRIRTSVGSSEAAFWLGYMTSTTNPRIGKRHPWLYFVNPQQQQQ